MKQYYIDNVLKNKSMDSQSWYTMQAIRATNQAIGRVIRHAQDYGNIILMDSRFGDEKHKNLISSWLKDNIKEYYKFDEAISDFKKFFKSMKSMNFKHKVDQLDKLNFDFADADEDDNFAKLKDTLKLKSKQITVKIEYENEDDNEEDAKISSSEDEVHPEEEVKANSPVQLEVQQVKEEVKALKVITNQEPKSKVRRVVIAQSAPDPPAKNTKKSGKAPKPGQQTLNTVCGVKRKEQSIVDSSSKRIKTEEN